MARRPSRTTPLPPRVHDLDLPAELEPVSALARHGHHLAVRFAGIGIPGEETATEVDAAYTTVTESELAELRLRRLNLTGARLIDVRIGDVQLLELAAAGSTLRRVSLHGGRIGTLDLSGATLEAVELRDLRIDYVNLSGASIEDLLVTDSAIGTLDLPDASVARASFAGVRVQEVGTAGLTASDLDLRGLQSDAFTDLAGLRGSTLTPAQFGALQQQLARYAGVQLKDED